MPNCPPSRSHEGLPCGVTVTHTQQATGHGGGVASKQCMGSRRPALTPDSKFAVFEVKYSNATMLRRTREWHAGERVRTGQQHA